jgi:hypothetical protein
MADRHATHAASHAATAPLWAVLAFTWVNSMATGIPYNGIFFITKNVYNFSPLLNCLMGVLLGITYVAGALATGPLLRRLIARGVFRGPRDALLALSIVMGLLCLLPLGAFFAVAPAERAGTSWSVWVFMALYSALCGGFWPVVESFLSGGRNSVELRSATGTFNVTWSSALVVSLWAMVPFAAEGQAIALGVSAFMHLASVAVLFFLPMRPGAHPEEQHAVPPIYRPLLRVHRVLLPTAYMVMYALSPVLPDLLARLRVEAQWGPALGSVWIAARVATFGVLQRWHGWHGRWASATIGTAMLLSGFGLALLSPLIGTGALGLVALVVGLIGFGCGAATIYCGALYYAMEVGSAEVEAGGMHEAMIGVGYTLGPICGLVPAAMATPALLSSGTMMTPGQAGVATVGTVGALAAVAIGAAWRTANRPENPPDIRRADI